MAVSHVIFRPAKQLVQIALVFLVLTGVVQPAAGQHRNDYRGVDARTFNPGRGPYATGASATYSSGRHVSGVVRNWSGAYHLSNGLTASPFYGTPSYSVGPGFYGYGTGYAPGFNPGYGWGTPGFPGWSPLGYVNPAPALTVDPWSGQLVPLNPWAIAPLPYFGGINPSYPGSVLAPTIINMNIAMRPSVPSTSVYSLPDPRLLNILAPPEPLMPAHDQGQQGIPLQDDRANVPEAPPLPALDRDVPLLNEFEVLPPNEKVAGLADKINSLRYQSSGDEAFRNEDYASAETAYRSAMEMAPERRAPCIRMAFVCLAQENFSDAARYLKTALKMKDDGTRAWISAEELYGSRVAERTRSHGLKLWNWLSERPMSSDRLLLAGTFQKLRGHQDVAAEMLGMASFEGPEAEYVKAVTAIADSDVGQRAMSQELDRMVQNASAKTPSRTPGKASVDGKASAPRAGRGAALRNSDGIVLRGTAPRPAATDDASDDNARKENASEDELPEDNAPDVAPPPLFIPPGE